GRAPQQNFEAVALDESGLAAGAQEILAKLAAEKLAQHFRPSGVVGAFADNQAIARTGERHIENAQKFRRLLIADPFGVTIESSARNFIVAAAAGLAHEDAGVGVEQNREMIRGGPAAGVA